MSVSGSVGTSSVRPAPGAHHNAAPQIAGPTQSRKRKDSYGYDYDSNNNHPSSSSSLLGRPRNPYPRQPPPQPPPEYSSFGKPPPCQQVPRAHPAPPPPNPHSVTKKTASPPAPVKPGGNRLLMASYLAHEFLSQGTLFGRPYGTRTTRQAGAKSDEDEVRQKQKQQYKEIASIMWGGGGVYVPGVVNPTQLGGWLQKQQENH